MTTEAALILIVLIVNAPAAIYLYRFWRRGGRGQ